MGLNLLLSPSWQLGVAEIELESSPVFRNRRDGLLSVYGCNMVKEVCHGLCEILRKVRRRPWRIMMQ